MIENPKVGQRACYSCSDHTVVWGTIAGGSYPRVTFVCDGDEPADWVWAHCNQLYDSPKTIAAEYRDKAQRLLDAADKLESEVSE